MSHTTSSHEAMRRHHGVFARISLYLEHLRWYHSREQVLIRKWKRAHDRGEGHTPAAIIRNKRGEIEHGSIGVIAPPDRFGRWTLYGGQKAKTEDIVDIDECHRLRCC